MSTAEVVIAKLSELTPEQQQEDLRLVERLASQSRANGRAANPIRALADLGLDIADGEIDGARREMWSGFPREDMG